MNRTKKKSKKRFGTGIYLASLPPLITVDPSNSKVYAIVYQHFYDKKGNLIKTVESEPIYLTEK